MPISPSAYHEGLPNESFQGVIHTSRLAVGCGGEKALVLVKKSSNKKFANLRKHYRFVRHVFSFWPNFLVAALRIWQDDKSLPGLAKFKLPPTNSTNSLKLPHLEIFSPPIPLKTQSFSRT